MSVISSEEKESMARLLKIMEGETVPIKSNKSVVQNIDSIELAGPGVPTKKDIDAMAGILSKLQSINPVQMINEHASDPQLVEAMETQKVKTGVKVGKFQIMIKEDPKRLAGKQYYSIYNNSTNDIIADDISLYETALTVVRLLNNGKYTNSSDVRKLFEYDNTYTSHRIDALLYKRKLNKLVKSDPIKQDIYESRYQASLDRAMIAKKQIKKLSDER